MPRGTRMVIEGFDEMDAALEELTKVTAKNAMVRTLKKAAQPIKERAQQLAPKLTFALEESTSAGTKLTPRQAAIARKAGKGFAEVYVGTKDPAAVPQEFGTVKAPPQPFMRPAWDMEVGNAMTIIKSDLKEELNRTAERVRVRKARKAGR